MAGRIVIAIYRPKEGKEEELLKLVKQHLAVLREQDMATKRPGVLMKSERDGTILEVFEWVSAEAAHSAHNNHQVTRLWENMAEISSFLPMKELGEADRPFAEFIPLEYT